MIIADDSPLRRIPSNLNHQQVLLLNGIRYTVDMADLAYSRLLDALLRTSRDHEKDRAGQLPRMAFTSAFLDAWSIIDSTNRLRVLLKHVKNTMKHKFGEQEVKQVPNHKSVIDFVDETKDVSVVRNRIQHLDGWIKDAKKQKRPVWGVLTWLYVSPSGNGEFYLNTMIAGSAYTVEQQLINVLGPKRVPIDRVTLLAYGFDTNLSEIMTSIVHVTRNIEAQTEPQFAGKDYLPEDIFWQYLFEPVDKDGSKQETD